MRREQFWALAIFIALAAGACDRGGSSSTQAAAPDADTALPQAVDIASHTGQSFEAFVGSPGMERFALDKLDLAPGERTRLTRAMAVAQPSRLISGGGAQALVFTGCVDAGCDAGLAVVAIGSRGETFVGVRDATGTSEFLPDDRIEALLRLNSPTRAWDDLGAPPPASSASAP